MTRCWSLISLALCAMLAAPFAFASTIDPRTRGVLDFIGSIEGPAGYDDYYRGVSSGPPRPLTTMTINEVLAWQDSIDAKSDSEAAGRYQIMEDTLRDLVRSGQVDPNRPFNAATQDDLAVMLMKRRGWNPNSDKHVAMGNALAYEWAALPLCSGVRAGRSAYSGVGNNKALTTCEAWMAVVANGDDLGIVNWALTESQIGTFGTGGRGRINNPVDRVLSTIKTEFHDLADRLRDVARDLFFSLLLIEWIWVTANMVVGGMGIGALTKTLATRLAFAGLFLFLLNSVGFATLVTRSAEALLMQTEPNASVNVIALFDLLFAYTIELWTKTYWNLAQEMAALVAFLIGIGIVALIIVAYIEVYIAFSAALIALAFGAFSRSRQIAVTYLKRCVSRVFRLFTALVIGVVATRLLQSEVEGAGQPFMLIGLLVILLVAMRSVPAAVEQSIFRVSSITADDQIGSKVRSSPLALSRFIGSK